MIADASGDGGAVGRFEIGNAKGDFFVQGQDFEAAGRGDGEGAVEEVEGVCFRGNVEVVEVAEEFGLTEFFAHAESCAGGGHGFLVDWFEDFEGRTYSFAFLVED